MSSCNTVGPEQSGRAGRAWMAKAGFQNRPAPIQCLSLAVWFDILPVIIIMAAAIFMMMIEVLETFDIYVADALAKKFLKKK